jgi:hypothetical protein
LAITDAHDVKVLDQEAAVKDSVDGLAKELSGMIRYSEIGDE